MGFGRRAVVATVGVLGLMLMGAWCWPAVVGVTPGRPALDPASQLVLEGGGSRGDEAMPAVAEPSAASAATPEAVLRAWFGSDAPLRVKAFKLVERDGTDREVYRAVISAEPDALLPYGWNPGDNIRWVMLQKAPSGWVMAEVASTPLSSSRP